MKTMKDSFQNSIVDFNMTKEEDVDSTTNFVEAQCFPLQSLLRAANLTSIDYFSLDVEGLELKILKTFPFQDFDIKVRVDLKQYCNIYNLKKRTFIFITLPMNMNNIFIRF